MKRPQLPPAWPLDAARAPLAVYPQDHFGAANDAAYRRHAGIAQLLRGFVIRWETLDFGVSANCFDLDDRMLVWYDADPEDPPPA